MIPAMGSSKIDRKVPSKDERMRIMLDAMPLCCNFWDEDYNNIDCNQEAVNLFELSSKQEYLDRFFELSPVYQPDGISSEKKAYEYIEYAFENGRIQFEWMHQKLNGEPVPSEITLVRVKYYDSYIVVGYTRDMREIKLSQAKMHEANERYRIMLDATPLCSNFWNSKYENVDCNQEAVNLFELSSKQEYLERFQDLSPKYQPDGRLSSEKAVQKIKLAFEEGHARFEWMHQKLNGELIPAEIILVRVKYHDDDIVLGYTRDLRELKETVGMMRQLEALAFTDSLTGAFNRRYFFQNAKQEFAKAELSNAPVSIIMLDLDKFKLVNDTHGHLAGDEVLKTVTRTVQGVLRSNELLARFGGEEFIILVADANLKLAEKIAWRINEEVARAVTHYMGIDIKMTVSLGVATKTAPGVLLDTVIEQADKALYEAKMSGRNKVVCYTPNR